MNTETRRHDEQSAYHRRAKYPDEPIIEDDTDPVDEEGGGVLDSWTDEAEAAGEPVDTDENGSPSPPRQERE